MPTLLVADDNRLSRELIRDLFESPDCLVVEASNGQEALERVGQANPDLVLLDIEMPLQDGFSVLVGIRSNPRFSGIPVLAVTAKALEPDRERIVAAGFDAYITKPIKTRELRRRVQELLNRTGREGRP